MSSALKLQPTGFLFTSYQHVAQPGTQLSDLVDEVYWRRSNASALKRHDEIQVVAEDGSFEARLRVAEIFNGMPRLWVAHYADKTTFAKIPDKAVVHRESLICPAPGSVTENSWMMLEREAGGTWEGVGNSGKAISKTALQYALTAVSRLHDVTVFGKPIDPETFDPADLSLAASPQIVCKDNNSWVSVRIYKGRPQVADKAASIDKLVLTGEVLRHDVGLTHYRPRLMLADLMEMAA